MAETYTIPEAKLTVSITGDDQSGYEWSLLDGDVLLQSSQQRGESCQSRSQALQAAFGFAVVCL